MSKPNFQRRLPKSTKNLRACLMCAILLTSDQFANEGCPNCESILRTSERPEEVTSPNHEGRIAMMSPSDSWVAKWQRSSNFVAGLYATRVVGRLADEIVEDLEAQGIQYIPRDGSYVE
ncbi:Transcription elongation factor spt-4 [Taphrina deformans PYCC 5710]|uniref:Transcription elongation factor SPT4 n=1 Tax=Taphrina deformans (strain PYCC 5710 / ATCC 11124 / CBS 356.35 / IMI 108563 / JCM 9778 / NBRC 8474) TaxID=1097556 RepID=R4XII3_TAPDE|nr:Transcription elongation factor spt-4 [Taphrina deformans PYCC 5710]|eukprot:CCG83167.1 Transcription elongation factor spt-4 [Taphrina deformans PYCC 5710]